MGHVQPPTALNAPFSIFLPLMRQEPIVWLITSQLGKSCGYNGAVGSCSYPRSMTIVHPIHT